MHLPSTSVTVTPPSGLLLPAIAPSEQLLRVGDSTEAQLASAGLLPRAGPGSSDERREAHHALAEQSPRAGSRRSED
jgi:hypothetical protein